MKPKKPKNQKEWFVQKSTLIDGFSNMSYFHKEKKLQVISSFGRADGILEGVMHDQFHVSISKKGERCSIAEANWVLGQFDMLNAIEDNHVPFGKVRNFWKPIEQEFVGIKCTCEGKSPRIVEGDRDMVYEWSFPHD